MKIYKTHKATLNHNHKKTNHNKVVSRVHSSLLKLNNLHSLVKKSKEMKIKINKMVRI